MKVKLKSGLLIRDVAGEKVLLATGRECVDFSHMLVLNESAALLITELMRGVEVQLDVLATFLMEHYEVEYNQAMEDVEELVSDLRKLDMLENI